MGQIEDRTFTRPELPRLLEQQIADFGRIVWSDGFFDDRFRERLHDAPEGAVHLVRAAGSLLVSHVGVTPVEVEGRDGPIVIGGVGGVMTYPRFRGEGHAGALMQRAGEHIHASGYDVGMLFCHNSLIPFYERFSWAALPRDRVLVQLEPHDDTVMVLGEDRVLPDVLHLDWTW